jgi:phenylpropionate dioxygenase-like ring-hydroxylating dioxygenase large terminal subunit
MTHTATAVTRPNLTLDHPELGTGPIPTDIYYKPEIYQQELEAIFKRTWIWVGRVNEVRAPGQFFVRHIPTFGYSVLLCRGRDGVLRGFYNTCRHRGHVVERRECGSSTAFTCGFHGWTYDLAGALRGVPDASGFHGLVKPSLGLRPLPTEVWEDFIFVYLGDRPAQSLLEFLGEQGADLVGYPFDACEQRFAFAAEIAANWKCMVDSFCESYHLPILHRRGIGKTMAGPSNPTCRLVDVRLKGPHRTISLWANKQYQPSPVQALAYENAPGPAITSGRAESSFRLPKGLNQTRSDSWSLDVTIFFPTFLIAIGTGMYFTHQIWPLASNRVRYEMRAYLRKAQNAAQRFAQEHALVELRDTLLEDTNTLERTQRALDAGIVRELVLHDHELALRHHYHTVCRYLDASR